VISAALPDGGAFCSIGLIGEAPAAGHQRRLAGGKAAFDQVFYLDLRRVGLRTKGGLKKSAKLCWMGPRLRPAAPSPFPNPELSGAIERRAAELEAHYVRRRPYSCPGRPYPCVGYEGC
jgi:hypothetical protein